ncbi:MAG: cupin domain-containing protein [Gammaproteobacteria bacterium]|nr:cupin domain-containing protein [Gammaproteobacteria bacterium]
MNLKNTRQISMDWNANGFSCDLWVDPPGQRWEDFVHGADELVAVLEGELEFEINGVISRSRIGEEILIPAGTVHSVRNIGKTTARWLYGYRK